MLRRRLAALLPIVVAASILAMGGTAGRAASPPPQTETTPTTVPDVAGEESIDTRLPVASPRGLTLAEADAQASLSHTLGRQGVFELDPRTGTARVVGRLDGTLTGPSSAPATAVAMDWVRRNLNALGLGRGDLRTFHLRRDYVDIDGTHHLSWIQSVNGIRAFDNGLLASVTADGRLVTVSGSPAHGLGRGTHGGPVIAANGAIALAQSAIGARTVPGPTDSARLVYFHGARSTLAYQTMTTTASGQAVSVIDATTGALLWRSSLSSDATGNGLAWGYYPSNAVPNGGGVQQPVTFPVKNGSRLRGNNAYAFLDTLPDFLADPGDEIPANSGVDWSTPAVLDTSTASQNCSPEHACTWDLTTPRSWRPNRAAGAVQAYYFVNHFHDHLLASPIGFTEAAGNFEQTNSSGDGLGGDAVQILVLFGASSDHGLPAPAFTNNASMSTPPDGQPPTLVLLLFRRALYGPTWVSASAGDDASVVYHEYTHGLSNRLVTYPSGLSALNSQQSASMGEAWSDWYALDELVDEGYITDTPASGEVMEGKWITGGEGIRVQSIDCAVGAAKALCPAGARSGSGGFTYADFGKVAGGPEVHSDGEIWAQTLWDLRDGLGVNQSEGLITRAMELSPPDPSYLDMRNAILQADVIANGGANTTAIWDVFRHRGMGFFASAADGNDVSPHANSSPPPDCAVDPCSTLHGRVTERLSGDALPGLQVALGGHDSGFPGMDLNATTDADGRFTIANVPDHSYTDLVVDGPGIEPVTLHGINVHGPTTVPIKVYRDWAAHDGGARIAGATPPNYGPYGCGPTQVIDRSHLFGWGSDAPGSTVGSAKKGPRSLIIKLPRTIDITAVAVDPGAICGDGPNAAVKDLQIFTRRASGGPWRLVVTSGALPQGVFTALHVDGPHARHARFVKVTMVRNRGNAQFMDMAEVSVRGRPS